MNKNLLFIGAVAVAGYLTLTAFGGKTKAEQMAEIKEKVQMGLDELRTAEKAACDARRENIFRVDAHRRKKRLGGNSRATGRIAARHPVARKPHPAESDPGI